MNYEDIYRAFFDESFEVLAPLIEKWRSRDEWATTHMDVGHEMNLFDPVDRKSLYYVYDQMVKSTQRLMSGHLEGLVRSMLNKDGRGYSTSEGVCHPNGYRWRDVPFSIDVDGRKVGLTFKGGDIFHSERLCASTTYDELLIVVATRTREGVFYRRVNENTRIVSLEELFEVLFPGEYNIFLNHVDVFNERVKERIALSLIEQPTEERMPDVRSGCLSRLRSDIEGIRDDLSTGVYLRDWERRPVLEGPSLSDQVDSLYERFLKDGTCEAMVGSCDFADSYVSSEWLYQINELTRTLEQTGTAVGYIKSIEQLLYDVALLFMEDEIYSMSWRDKEGISKRSLWDKAFPDPDKLPLWDLIDFFSEDTNIGILGLNSPFDMALQQVLHSFRSEDRNKYLHKANLIGNDGLRKLYEVRKKAELIYLLVLGGCRIPDSRLSQLGLGIEATESAGREVVSEWARRMVNLQAFRRDAVLADGVRLELSVDTTVRGARRAFCQKDGEYWELRIELRYRGVTFKSSALGQPYELPLTWHGREEWESLAVWLKSVFEEALDEANIIGGTGAPLDVSVAYTHMESEDPYKYRVHGSTGHVIVDKELLQLPPNSRKSKGD